MSDSHEYRCLACMDATVARDFDVSHLSRTCESCGEFGRFVNTIVLDQFEVLEADPPPELHWDRLDRARKFFVAERLTRGDYDIEDFDVEVTAESEADEGPASGDDADETAASDADASGNDAEVGEE